MELSDRRPPPCDAHEDQMVYPPPPDVDAEPLDAVPPPADPIPILEPDEPGIERGFYAGIA
jgi:hypothetical protein